MPRRAHQTTVGTAGNSVRDAHITPIKEYFTEYPTQQVLSWTLASGITRAHRNWYSVVTWLVLLLYHAPQQQTEPKYTASY